MTGFKHGGQVGGKSRLYACWDNMKRRCLLLSCPGYKNYGGRGITICDEWKNFVAFRDWAYKHGYTDYLTIERIDNDKGYSPENCRWALLEEQANNRRNNVKVSAFGENKTLAEWVEDERCKVNYECLRIRLEKSKKAEEAITTPKHGHKQVT